MANKFALTKLVCYFFYVKSIEYFGKHAIITKDSLNIKEFDIQSKF